MPNTSEIFEAVVLSGHKENAVEVPFDPAERWGVPPAPLWPGRNGHRVEATVNGVAFESAIVPRSRRHWLLIADAPQARAGVSVGETIQVQVKLLGGTQ